MLPSVLPTCTELLPTAVYSALSEYYMQPDDILKDLGELLKEHIR